MNMPLTAFKKATSCCLSIHLNKIDTKIPFFDKKSVDTIGAAA